MGGYDIISNPLINTVLYLADKRYKIDIFSVQSKAFSKPDFQKKNVNLYTINSNFYSTRFIERFIRIFRIWYRIKNQSYDFIIGFDHEGLFYASLFGILKRTPYIYHNLEISLQSTLDTVMKKIKKERD